MLLTVPGLVSGVLEPFLALLGNARRRRVIVTAGGTAFAAALVIIASAGNFMLLLLGLGLLYPASGAFVGLSQANLMDRDPRRHEQSMARWVLAGSVGVVLGPLAFAATRAAGWGWRSLFLALALLTLALALGTAHGDSASASPDHTLRESAGAALRALRHREVVRWLALLELTDLLGDVLTGFLALYFVDVVHVSVATAAFAIVLWSVSGLVGDALLVPLLERVSGIAYLRLSALLALLVYPGLLLAPGLLPKLILLGALGLLHAGWYAIPQGRLYSELDGNSGAAVAVSNIAGLPASAFPLLLGLLAQRFGLTPALWCCLVAPLGLLLGLRSVLTEPPSRPTLNSAIGMDGVGMHDD